MVIEYLASEGGIALLDVNPGLAIWTTITFLVVFLILKYFAWGPIAQALDSRAEKIHTDIERAEAIRKEAEGRLADYMARLDGLQAEGQKIVADARKDAEKLKEEILEAARKEAETQREKGVHEVRMAADQALDRLHKEVASLSVAIAGQILGKTLKADEHKQLIEDSLAKLKSNN